MYKNYIKPINLINESDLNKIGGKGKSIYLLNKNNIKIPKSFYILDSVFKIMIKDTGIDKDLMTIQSLCKNDLLKLNSISKVIIAKILNYKIPSFIKNEIFYNLKKFDSKYLVVRSSATAEDSLRTSWAGILESYLYADNNNILNNILKCYSSLFKMKSLIYLKINSNNIDNLCMSIIIQEMINSDIAGVCFTIDPIFKEKKILIDYCDGLCKNIVDGSIIPKQYTFDKYSYNLIDGDINSVEYNKISALLNSFIQIENIFKFPQDIEWCLKNEQLYILQSRPITTIEDN